MANLVLASLSPRRKELLKQILDDLGRTNRQFEVIGADIEEIQKPGESPIEFAKRLAFEKAQKVYSSFLTPKITIAADTIVVLKDVIYGKPKNDDDAIRMLTELSDKTHQVITAFSIIIPQKDQNDKVITSYDATQVTFKNLASEQIKNYVTSKEPLDKAGAYGIQGGAKDFVAATKGSHSNVVGLPIEKLTEILRQYLD